VIGVDTYRRILELCASEGCQTAVVSRAVAALPWGTSLFEYQYIDDEKEYLESSETTLGNFALACYLKDHEVDDRRFTFLEAREPIYIDEIVPGAPQSDTLVPVKVQDTKTVRANAAAAFSGTVAALGSVYYEIDVENGVENVALAYVSSSAGSGAQCQVVIITADGKVKDIIRTDRDRFHKHIVCGLEDGRVARLVAVVTGGSSDDTYQISVAPGVPASDVMITRWNTEIGREYHMDPRGGAWTWTSPDIQVRPTDRDADYDLRICVRNKGNSRARSVSLSPEYRPMDDSRWRPVAGPTGDPVNAPAADLDVGTEHTFMFHWRPEGVAAGGEYLIRAKVRSPDDMNRDNVTAVTRWSIDRLV
jgi:hypothetical protein